MRINDYRAETQRQEAPPGNLKPIAPPFHQAPVQEKFVFVGMLQSS
jgi:hypothetical protein